MMNTVQELVDTTKRHFESERDWAQRCVDRFDEGNNEDVYAHLYEYAQYKGYASGMEKALFVLGHLARELPAIRTCELEEQGWSTEGDHARVWLTCGHDCMVETVADLPKFCPECGAKVVSE